MVLGILLGFGSTKPPEVPDWINGESIEFPRDRYLVGVGIADDRSSAENRARGKIAQIFKVEITVDQRDLSSEQRTATQGKPAEVCDNNSLTQSVQAMSRAILEGVETPRYWQDKTTAQHYALAVLSRVKAARIFSERIAQADSVAIGLWNQMNASTDRLNRVQLAMKLLAALKARGDLNGSYRVVAPDGGGIPCPIDEGAIRAAAAKAIETMNVVVNVKGERAQAIDTAIIEQLNSLGLHALSGTTAATNVDIVVEGTIRTAPIAGFNATDGKFWARSTVTVQLLDARSLKIFVRLESTEKAASRDAEEAMSRSAAGAGKKIAPQINDEVTRFFENG